MYGDSTNVADVRRKSRQDPVLDRSKGPFGK